MSVRLVVESVNSSSELRRCLSPGQAENHGEFDGETLVVESQSDAERLIERYPNVRYESEPVESRDGMDVRFKADNDGVREVSSEDAPQGSDAQTDYAEMPYSELRQIAADADTDEIDGRSSKDEIVAYFSE